MGFIEDYDFLLEPKPKTFEDVRKDALRLAPTRCELETALFMIDTYEKHKKTANEAYKAMMRMLIFNLSERCMNEKDG